MTRHSHDRNTAWACQHLGCPHTATRLIRRGESMPYLYLCDAHSAVFREARVGYTPPLKPAKRGRLNA